MKAYIKKLLTGILAGMLCVGIVIPACAAGLDTEQQTAAAYLREKGVMTGDSNGDMMLGSGLTRAQMAVLLARITVNPEHLAADRAFYSKQCGFTDVPDWAKPYVGYCASNYLVIGYDNGLYGANDSVTPAAACTVMLRCLGDIGMDWDYNTACQTATSIGLAPAEALNEAEISRGNMVILVYRTMAKMGFDAALPEDSDSQVTGAGGLSRNADGSINIPSDGSRYIPQAGDVIRCDDGSNYTIRDVSRYDKNMFASGPLPELPTPTCDWSKLPQPELPAAEVRHFTLASGEYMFVRNLYETRRMLYTLYNAIGSNPETWQDGEPVLRPSGDPKVSIYLTIPTDRQPESFWPWRDREIVGPFNARPCGSYYMECWDVYKDGVFQKTEYDILQTT